MNKSRGVKRKSSGSCNSLNSFLHIITKTDKSKADHQKSKLVAESEAEIAKKLNSPVSMGETDFQFESLGFGSAFLRDGTEIQDEKQAKKWRSKTIAKFDHYYSQTPDGRWKRRKRKGAILKKETITLYPEHDYILRALDKLGVDISDFVKVLAEHLAEQFDKIDPNENVILTAIHPNAGCLHIHFITTRFVEPTQDFDKVTLKNQNTQQGNNRSPHAGPALISLLRLRDKGIWPNELSEDLDKFLRKRERATERLPTDYLVCEIADRFIEKELPKLYRCKPTLEAAFTKAKNDYKEHAELVAQKRLHEFRVENGEIPEDETLEMLKSAKSKKEKLEKELRTLESEANKLAQSLAETSAANKKLIHQLATDGEELKKMTFNKAKLAASLQSTKSEGNKLASQMRDAMDFIRTLKLADELRAELARSTLASLNINQEASKSGIPNPSKQLQHLLETLHVLTSDQRKELEANLETLESYDFEQPETLETQKPEKPSAKRRDDLAI